ncbi:TolC family protein [Sinomicrobium weinanense]|uniref:TolC family protein n=1 Tax=Sinomicrobium weinanense TaxID=2842200 RepID=A0A926JP57_9FLAO|nr:TolC family protein [Sinomicrobium weinanense]MBC9794910.1 TolC family protein [Sinomicrobium weinanense]MBU3125681.1 TolC family protein [Sinomicrobium weinanense]
MKNVLPIIILLFSVGLAAQEKLNLSLDEAIEFALENNRTVRNAENDIEIAKKQKWETTATGLPQIDVAVDYTNNLKQQVSLIPAEIFGGEPGTFEEVVFGTKHNVTAMATLKQKIFDGSYLVGLQSAKVYLEISKNDKKKTNLDVKKAVIDAYGNVLLAEENIRILEKNKEILEKNVYETQKTYENGLAEEESVEQLQITLAGVESDLSNNMRLRDIAYKMLNITIGADIDTEITLTDHLDDLAIENTIPGLAEQPLLIENNINYKIASNNQRAQELLLKNEKSKALPTLEGYINGGYLAFGDNFNFLKREQEWFGNSAIGLSLNVPIFSSLGRSAATQRMKIELEKAKNDLKETEQQLQLELQRARSDYQFVLEQYQNKKKSLELAERIERKNQVKFSEGMVTSFDLRQAQEQLYTAQQEYLQSMLDIINTKTDLEIVLHNANE